MSQAPPVHLGHSTLTPLAFDEAVRQTKAALAEQGFGVLCEI
jgi:uncharacterized protein (DUF302 family)